MSMTQIHGPTEDEWALHRGHLTRLYLEENKPLHKVMSLMAETHGFVAKKNQYEKYLHNKWRLRKKTSAQLWKSVVPVVLDLERRGQTFELWINNEKKSAQTIRKEVRRYTRSGDLSSRFGESHSCGTIERSRPRLVNSNQLPQGVMIREVASCVQPQIYVDLPFLTLERYLEANLPIIRARSILKYSPPACTLKVALVTPLALGGRTSKMLQLVELNEHDLDTSFSIVSTISSSAVFSSPLRRQILFSLTNNFAGLDGTSNSIIRKILWQSMSEGSLGLICWTNPHHSIRAAAQSIFLLAIKHGDAEIVDFLLNQSIPGIEPNRFFGTDSLFKKTPIEIAMEAEHRDLVKLLLRHGANPNLALSEILPHPSSALDMYLGHGIPRHKHPDPELIELLLNSGATLSLSSFKYLIATDRYRRSVHLVLSKFAASQHKVWSLNGIFHYIFKFQEHDVMLKTLEVMLRYNVDINKKSKSEADYSDRILQTSYRHTREFFWSLVDITTRRGNLAMLKVLLESGAQLSEVTLVLAIHSRCEPLIRWVLNQGCEIHCRDAYWDLAMAAAIRSGDTHILELINTHCQHITKPFYSALLVASRLGKWDLFRRFYHPNVNAINKTHPSERCYLCDIPPDRCMLDWVLSYSIKDGQDSIATELLDAGVDASCPNVDDGFRDLHYQPVNWCSPLTPFAEVPDTPLVEALKRRNTQMVNLLLDAGAVVNGFNRSDSSLRYAVEWGDPAIIQSILDAGLKVNGFSSLEALNIVIARKEKDLLDLLLSAGVSINLEFPGEVHKNRNVVQTALETAVESNDFNMVEHVLRLGADPHNPGAFTQAFSQDSAIFDLLLRRHTLVYPGGRRGWGAQILMDIIGVRDLESFEGVLRAGADANELLEGDYGLVCSESLGDADAVTAEIPITLGRTRYYKYMSAFGYAIAMSSTTGLEFVDCLLQTKRRFCYGPETFVSEFSTSEFSEGVCGFQESTHRQTAFLLAVETADIPTIELFIRHNADINFPARLNVKRTPLQQAAEQGSLEVVRLLLKHGADVNGPAARSGEATALQLAALKGYIRISLLLLEHGADVHAPKPKAGGRTALEAAAEHGRLDTVALLLQYYGPYDIKHEVEFVSAMNYASSNGFDHIVDLLRQHQLVSSPAFNQFLDFGTY